MPFSGPQGQGPFDDYDACVRSMQDEDGIDDPEGLCATWMRMAEGKADVWADLSIERKRQGVGQLYSEIAQAASIAPAVPTLLAQADVPEKYVEGTPLSEADFVPNADVAAAAQDAIDYVDEHGLPNPDDQREGIARAHQLVDHHDNDEPLAPAFWEEIKNFHARHRQQGNHECDEAEYDPCMADPGVFSDHTWGSTAGKDQAERIASVIDDVDAKAATGHDTLTTRQKATAATGLDVLGGVPPALDDAIGQKQAGDIDLADLSEKEQAAIEADDFLIYGKASIEQYDVENQRIAVEALENALDRFFESEDAPGIISREHADVPVGMPVREHTLDEGTTLVIDGDRHQFDAGDTIRTEAKDADDDGLPELWLVSRLANDSEIAKETRLRALHGDLNGYSVTVKPHADATERTAKGQDINAVDLHAVTVGSDRQIKNKGSEFDVAEFKLSDLRNASISDVSDALRTTLDMSNDDILDRLLMRAADNSEDAQSDGTGAAGDESLASPLAKAVEDDRIGQDVAQKLDDATEQKLSADAYEPVLAAVADDGLAVDKAVSMLDAMAPKGDYEDDDDESEEKMDDAGDDDDDDEEMKADADADGDDTVSKMDVEAVAEDMAARFDIPVDEVMEHLDVLEMAEADHGELKAAAAAKAAEVAAGERATEAIEEKLDDLDSRIEDTVDQKLDDMADDVDDAVESKMDDLIQNADVTNTPNPSLHGDDGEVTLRESTPLGGDQ